MKSNTELFAIAKAQMGKGGATFRKYTGLSSGQPWCDAFVFWLFNANGCKELLPWTGRQRTYCPASIKWCEKNLAQIPPYLAMQCDIIYFDWERNGVPNHIGLVWSKKTTGTIYTLEGNTSGGKVDDKNRDCKYVQAVYRPHFKATFTLKKLTVDGECGYNTIAGLQKALQILKYYNGAIDGILGQGTVKALQKWAGTSADGAWGNGTSKAVQKKIGTKVDGAFGKNSVIALQKWVNANAFPSVSGTKPATKPTTKAQAAVDWGKKIAKSGKYSYKKWNNKKKNTKLCPICHPGSGNGWNCIGLVSACWYHGAGVKDVTCSCSGIGTDSFFTKATLASWQKRNGKNWVMITNGGSKGGADIPASKLLLGDTLICYDKNGKFKHIAIYSGNGKILESTKTRTPNVGERTYKDLCGRHHVTRAFRYTG